MAGRISPQAKSIVDALTGIGLSRRQFKVTTDTTVTREEDGSRYREYGHAHMRNLDMRAQPVVHEHAEHLAARGLTVTRYVGSCGHVRHVAVSTEYNPRQTVSEHRLEGACLDCRTAGQ